MNIKGLTAFGPPVLPKWLLFLRIAILVVSLGILIAAAYNLSLYSGYVYVSGPAGFLIFDSIFTFLIFGPMIAFELYFPKFYFRLAFVVLLGLDIIFWLSGWAWAASWAGQWYGLGGISDFYDAFSGSMTAGAVLGAFVWIMIIVTTVFFVKACLADTDGAQQYGAHDPANSAELGQRKPEASVAVNPQYGVHPPTQEPRYT